jgi:hypothetical protein
MGVTKQIPRSEWKNTFDRFTREHLADDRPETVTIEVVSPTLGDQFAAQAVRLEGLVYEPKSQVLEVVLEDMDHLVFQPTEIWAIKDDDGFLSTVEIGRADGTKELIYIHRSGPPARLSDVAPPFPPRG